MIPERNKAIILGIESSCDETSVAILKGFEVESHVVYSQMIHKKYGGVVPELASRAHEESITLVCDEAFRQSNYRPENIDAVAVTYGPGLMGALLVGLNFAKGFSLAAGKPLIGINHVEAHLYAPMLQFPDLQPPFLCLLVSGGHTMIVDVRGIKDFRILGRTRDDAAGESFDKTARVLGIGYPGGPIIDKISEKGDPAAIHFPRSLLGPDSLDFSFSGMKTSVLNYVRKHQNTELTDKIKYDICAGFQEAVVDVLTEKIRRAIKKEKHKKVVIAGGVAANRRLRRAMKDLAEKEHFDVYYPPMEYCTDNAAMIAAAGVIYYSRGWISDYHIGAVPNLSLN